MKHPEKEFSQSARLKKGQAVLGIRPKKINLCSRFVIYLFFIKLVPNEAPGIRILTDQQPKKAMLLCCFRD